MSTLTETDRERADRLHAESIVVDTLVPDGPNVYTPEMLERLDVLVEERAPTWQVMVEMDRMAHRARLHGELAGFWEGWDQAGVDVVSLTVGAFGPRPFMFESAVRDMAQIQRAFEAHPDRLVKVTSAADAHRVKAEGKRGIILNFQNSDHLEGELDRLELFYNLGLRVLMPTYNARSLAGDGCTERVQAGLTHFGVRLVNEMNALGMLVDLSHCGDATTLDAIEVSSKPVAITHACAKGVLPHDRAKPDDVIRAIGEAGGYFGVCIVPFFISAEPKPTLDAWLRQVEYVADLAGIENVGIGTDWGSEFPRALEIMLDEEVKRLGFREEHRVDWGATSTGYESWRDWPNLTRALVGRGYGDDEIRGVLGGNFLRVFDDAVKA